MRELGSEVVVFFAAYFVLLALMFPVMLLVRGSAVGERAERRLLQSMTWLALLIPLVGLVVLTLAFYLSPL